MNAGAFDPVFSMAAFSWNGGVRFKPWWLRGFDETRLAIGQDLGPRGGVAGPRAQPPLVDDVDLDHGGPEYTPRRAGAS